MRQAIVDEILLLVGDHGRRDDLHAVVDASVTAGGSFLQALVNAGLHRDLVLTAAATVSGLTAAPGYLVQHPQVPVGVDLSGVRDAGGVPLGIIKGRTWIGFSDLHAAKAAFFPDDIVVCLVLPHEWVRARNAFDAAHPPEENSRVTTMVAQTQAQPAPTMTTATRSSTAPMPARQSAPDTEASFDVASVVTMVNPGQGKTVDVRARSTNSEEDLFDPAAHTPSAASRTQVSTNPWHHAERFGLATLVDPIARPALANRTRQDQANDDSNDSNDSDDSDANSSTRSSRLSTQERLALGRLAQLGGLKRFRFLKPLGTGGMATVYLANDRESGRDLAVKVFGPRLSEQPLALARFARALRAMRTLNHPHVMRIFDGEAKDGGVCWLCAPYLDGGTLKELLEHTGTLSLSMVLPIFCALLQGISHAHARGVLHGELKPQNMLLSSNGDVQIADLGLAQLYRDDPLSSSGVFLELPGYLAPEQARGDEGDEKSDLFALGVIAVQMLTGLRSWAGDSSGATFDTFATGALPPLLHLPAPVAAVIKRLCAPDPRTRFQSAAEAHALLLPALAQCAPVSAVVAAAVNKRRAAVTGGTQNPR